MTPSHWTIHKFGGTSVASASRYKSVPNILQNTQKRKFAKQGVVVSAMSGVTNALIELVELAKKRDPSYLQKLQALKIKHFETIDELIAESHQASLKKIFSDDYNDLTDILRGIYLSRTSSTAILDLISGHGEIWSAQLLNTYLQTLGLDSQWLDARLVLVVNRTDTGVTIDWKTSRLNLKKWLKVNSHDYLIITGFIAATPEGVAATLGRNGSDYSATIFGDLFSASEITIWTDVDGVLSADPKLVPDAVVLDEMSYSEATELAYFGAKVVHPSTMAPAINKKIPVWIRNTFQPEFQAQKSIITPSHLTKRSKGLQQLTTSPWSTSREQG